MIRDLVGIEALIQRSLSSGVNKFGLLLNKGRENNPPFAIIIGLFHRLL